jgi:hypothetical protein
LRFSQHQMQPRFSSQLRRRMADSASCMPLL